MGSVDEKLLSGKKHQGLGASGSTDPTGFLLKAVSGHQDSPGDGER